MSYDTSTYFPDVEKIYKASDSDLLMMAFPMKAATQTYGAWYRFVANALSCKKKSRRQAIIQQNINQLELQLERGKG